MKLLLTLLLIFTVLTCKAPTISHHSASIYVEKVSTGTYETDLYIVVTADTNLARTSIDTIIKGTDADTSYSFANAEAETFYNGQWPIAIWIQKIPSTPEEYGTLNHEMLHATIGVMRATSIPLTDESEEAYTYEMGYISEQILARFRKIKEE